MLSVLAFNSAAFELIHFTIIPVKVVSNGIKTICTRIGAKSFIKSIRSSSFLNFFHLYYNKFLQKRQAYFRLLPKISGKNWAKKEKKLILIFTI
jgi:hypothetical protein